MPTKTRYPELQYEHRGDHWRIVDASGGAGIGPQYPSKAELLADLDRYAVQFGCAGAAVAVSQPMGDVPADVEALIDRAGLSAVLLAIETVCFEKADHIRSNWQDGALAKQWVRDAKRVGRVAREVAG